MLLSILLGPRISVSSTKFWHWALDGVNVERDRNLAGGTWATCWGWIGLDVTWESPVHLRPCLVPALGPPAPGAMGSSEHTGSDFLGSRGDGSHPVNISAMELREVTNIFLLQCSAITQKSCSYSQRQEPKLSDVNM